MGTYEEVPVAMSNQIKSIDEKVRSLQQLKCGYMENIIGTSSRFHPGQSVEIYDGETNTFKGYGTVKQAVIIRENDKYVIRYNVNGVDGVKFDRSKDFLKPV